VTGVQTCALPISALVEARGDVRLIRQENAGPAAARNNGAWESTGDWIVFTDSDCVPEPDWLAVLFKRDHARSVVAVGGGYTIANPESWLARVIQAEIDARHALMTGPVDFLGSFNVAYQRGAFVAAGGFDIRFRQASGEDNDLAYRLQQGGGELWFEWLSKVGHYHPERLLPYLKTQMRHGYWRVLLYRLHPKRTSSGDDYAGLVDLVSPPLILGFMFLALVLSIASGIRMEIYLGALVLPLCLLLFAEKAGRIAQHSSPANRYVYLVLAPLRDLARGIGLVWGVWDFLILRRSSG